MAEERGFESLFFPDHTHIPVSRETPYPAGGELPDEYSRTYDPIVACMSAAAATERLRVGTGICLLVERDPIITAKETATVDRLSGGRFLFGVGAGWNVEEMANHGTDASKRFGLLRERVEAIRAIWAEDEASYHGKHVDFDPIWSLAQADPAAGPAGAARRQRPHGGRPRAGLRRRVVSQPHWRRGQVHRADREAAPPRAGGGRAGDRRDAPAGAHRAARASSATPQAGVHRCVWYLPPRDLASVERALDRYTAAKDAYEGAG